jgi:hypothetical protein
MREKNHGFSICLEIWGFHQTGVENKNAMQPIDGVPHCCDAYPIKAMFPLFCGLDSKFGHAACKSPDRYRENHRVGKTCLFVKYLPPLENPVTCYNGLNQIDGYLYFLWFPDC